MKRKASCHCGRLSATCAGDPALIAMCHCELCQRRTGTSYNLGAWFGRTDVEIEGEQRAYTRAGDSGTEMTFHFCPKCGTSLYWDSPDGRFPEMLAVAVGCFADSDFPAPTISLFGKRRHAWLSQPAGMPSLVGGLGSAPE
jgi:hypothetical protein